MCNYSNHVSTSQYNFDASLHNIPEAVSFFGKLDQQVQDMAKHLYELPDFTARVPFYFVATFLRISQRQMRNGFILLLRRMSYDAMLVFRVGLEASVFAYRIFKRPELVEIWARKNDGRKDWKKFSKEFRRTPFPEDMPFATAIRRQLDLLNDYWAHPNINYFSRAVKSGNTETLVYFFDHDNTTFCMILLLFLDSCLKILACYRKMLEPEFRVFITSTESDYRRLTKEFERLKDAYRRRWGSIE